MGREGNRETCVANSLMVADYARKFAQGTLVVFLGLDQKRSGRELTYTNQVENGTMSLKLWCLISVKADISFFVDPVLLKEEIWRAKEKENCPYISMAAMKPWTWFFVPLFPSISSVSPKQQRKCVKNGLGNVQMFEGYREARSAW